MTREQFIKRAEAVQEAAQKYWEFERQVCDFLGSKLVDKFYETGVFAQMIQTLQDAVNDKNDYIYHTFYYNRGRFPLRAFDDDGNFINLKDWGEIYDFILNENRNS